MIGRFILCSSFVLFTVSSPALAGDSATREPIDVRLGSKVVLESQAKAIVGPSVQIDTRNRAHVAWLEEADQQRRIRYAKTADAESGFAAPVVVNQPDEQPYWRQEAPALDVSGNEVYIAWAKTHPGVQPDKPFANELRLSRSTDGGASFLPSTLVNDDGALINHSFDSIQVAKEGAVHVAWIDGRENKKHPGTFVSRSTDGGRTFTANTKIDEDTCVCCRTAVAVGPDGTIYVAWRKIFGDIRETVVARSTDGGLTYSAPVVVGHDRWAYPSCPHRPASLGVDRRGRVYIVWYTEGEDETPAVYLAYSDDHGQTFSSKRMLNASKGTFPDHPQLAVDPHGHVVATWEELSPVRREVVMSYSVDRGQTFSRPQKLNERRAEHPDVAANETGRFVLAWKEHVMPAGHRLVLQFLDFADRARVAHQHAESPLP